MKVIDRGVVDADVMSAVLGNAVVVTLQQPVLAVEGPGAVECLQGVLTNDVDSHGDAGFLYGAVLTPKGMISCDLWTARERRERLELYPSPEGVTALQTILQRYFPPRLARVSDQTEDTTVIRLAGPKSADVASRAGIAMPEFGHVERGSDAVGNALIARPSRNAPFTLQIAVSATAAKQVIGHLTAAGAVQANEAALELARLLSGWPRLGVEIDQKTLPQEVRFDEHEGVSYTKGCYTGQETVARVHFRGHPNRRLVGLTWQEDPDLDSDELRKEDKAVGRVTTVAWVGDDYGWMGLALLRREVALGGRVIAAQHEAIVSDLPFSLDSGSLVG